MNEDLLKTLPPHVKACIMRMFNRLPKDKRVVFIQSVREHGQDLLSAHTAQKAFFGFLVGCLLDALPLEYLTGISDFSFLCTLAGLGVGYLDNRRERQLIEATILRATQSYAPRSEYGFGREF